MKKTLGLSAAVLALGLLSACGGGGSTPAAGGAPTTSGGTGTGSPSGSVSDAPTLAGDGGTGCLVAGSPWAADTADLARQFPLVMSKINVTGAHIVGTEKLVVGSDLQATFSDDSVTTITVDMSQGLTMKLVQTHSGTATGKLTSSGNKLNPDHWTGAIHGTNKITINGHASQAPFDLPDASWGQAKMTYSCSGDTLKLQVKGSPFHYVFHTA